MIQSFSSVISCMVWVSSFSKSPVSLYKIELTARQWANALTHTTLEIIQPSGHCLSAYSIHWKQNCVQAMRYIKLRKYDFPPNTPNNSVIPINSDAIIVAVVRRRYIIIVAIKLYIVASIRWVGIYYATKTIVKKCSTIKSDYRHLISI